MTAAEFVHKCPHCGNHLGPSARDPVDELRKWCTERGHYVSPTGEVMEDAAAAAIGRSPGTLRNWRSEREPALPFRKTRAGVRYALADLAAFLRSES